ncbi:hypothetical protein C8R44DRAFT_778941 [Mycena epipterygia]|nr:hypothetical protein C8R44DRAFT_778941 [Mycena epipterygia]
MAPCFAKDVFAMRESCIKGTEFFWLGCVPCRSVKLVGFLVSVNAYNSETRIVYFWDDGTAVLECHHRPPAPNKLKEAKSDPESRPLLEAVVDVGCSIIIIGRILLGTKPAGSLSSR